LKALVLFVPAVDDLAKLRLQDGVGFHIRHLASKLFNFFWYLGQIKLQCLYTDVCSKL
jgi:hypothetical protein